MSRLFPRSTPVCAIAALAALSGCMVGPDYAQPELPVPPKFDRALPAGVVPGMPPTERWWLAFRDPLLEEFIVRAEMQNLDLKAAVSTLEQFRAQYDITFAQLFPDIDANVAYSRNKVTGNAIGVTQGADASAFDRWTYGMEMATWEIDLWGKLRRQVEGAMGRYQATAEEYRAALVSIRADVAQSYVAVRTLQAQRVNAAELAEALQRVVKITEAQVRYQTANKIDLAEARARRSASLAEVARIDGQLAEQISGLSLLLGEVPGEVRRQIEKPRPIPMPHGEVAVGIPADLLRRRPDVRAAERALAAYTADVGAAVANFYPELSLSGAIGVDASSFTGMGNVSSNYTFFFGPSVRWDFFRIVKGQTQAEVNVAKARMNSALVDYQRSVLSAMKQVDAALGNYSASRGVRDSYAEAYREVNDAYGLAMRKYEMGTIDLTQLIQFLEILIQSRDGLSQGEGLVAQNLIELYRSLGGGWETAPLPPAADPVAALISYDAVAEPSAPESANSQ